MTAIPTRVDPLPFKAAFWDDEVQIAVPVIVEEKHSGGWRSLLDLQTSVLFKLRDDFVPQVNGGKVGFRLRW